MSNPQRVIRVFISSPGDVLEERDRAQRVVELLQRRYRDVILQTVRWEELALPATASFQETIELILNRNPIDIAVFILWSRLGSPLNDRVLRPDGSPYRSGTEREFDLMLEAYRQSGGQRPVIFAYSRNDDEAWQRELAKGPKDQIQNLLDQRKLAESFIREQFHDEHGHNLLAYHPYREPIDFTGRLRVHLRQAIDDLLGLDWAPRWEHEPYRGLEAFDVQHADIFYGRDEETWDLSQRLREQAAAGCAFAVIVGASGSGKSSLARAGVAANLSLGSGEDGVKEWRTVAFIPSAGTGDLLTRLIRELANAIPDLRSSETALDDITAGLEQDPALTVRLSIVPAFSRTSERAQGPIRLLLIVDQLEELWTGRKFTTEDREHFLTAIEALAKSGCISVLATLRSDFYPLAQQMPAFLRLKGDRGHFDLLPPDTGALHQLITEPARLAGLHFERHEQTGRSLDELILQDAARDASVLPLLQYALSELYQQRDEPNHRLTFAAYQSLGAVEGALGKRAEDTFQSLPDDARAALEELLPLLVTVDMAGEQSAVRRRALLTALTATPSRQRLTDSMIAARFLTTDSQYGTPIASFSHEALLRCWARIFTWISANREHLRLQARIEQSQERWEQHDRDESLLLQPGLPLEEGRQVLTAALSLLPPATVEYLSRSIDHQEQQQRHTRRRRQAVLTALSLLTVVACLGGVFARIKQNEATRQRVFASAALQRAEQQHAKASRANAEHLWGHATNIRHNDPIWSGQLYLQSANAISEISTSESTESDQSARMTAAHAAHFSNRTCTRSWLHDGPVLGVQLSKDGRRLLSWSADGTARLWDASTHRPLHVLQHTYPVTNAVFSGDESQVLTTGDKTVRLWDAATGGELLVIDNGNPLEGATFVNDDNRILTLSDSRNLTLWDVGTKSPIASSSNLLRIDWRSLRSCNNRFVAWKTRHELALIDATTLHELRTFPYPSEPINAALCASGSLLAVSISDGSVQIWDIESGSIARTLRFPSRYSSVSNRLSILQLYFTQDGTYLCGVGHTNPSSADPGYTGTAFLWNLANDQEPRTLAVGHHLRNVQISSDGSYIFACSDNGPARIWTTHNGELLQTMEYVHSFMNGEFNADSSQLLTCSRDGTARLWQIGIHAPICLIRHAGPNVRGRCCALSDSFLTWGGDGAIRHWQTTNSRTRYSDDIDIAPYGHDISSDMTRLLIWGADGSSLSHTSFGVLDSNTLELRKSPKQNDDIGDADFAAGSNRVLVHSTSEVSLWEPDANTHPMRFSHNSATVRATVSHDGSRILTVPEGNRVILSDTRTMAVLAEFDSPDDLNGMAFSPNGAEIVTWSSSYLSPTISIWDPGTGRMRRTVFSEFMAQPPLFSGDSRKLFICDGNQVVVLNPDSCDVVDRLLHENLSGCRVSEDGREIVTWSGGVMFDSLFGGELRIWSVGDNEPTARLRHVLPCPDGITGVSTGSTTERFLAWGLNGTAMLWSREDPGNLHFMKSGRDADAGSINSTSTRFVTSGRIGDVSSMELWSPTRPLPIMIATTQQKIEDIWFVGDSLILAISSNGSLVQWDVSDPLKELSVVERILELEVRSGTTLDEQFRCRTLTGAEWRSKLSSREYKAMQSKLRR